MGKHLVLKLAATILTLMYTMPALAGWDMSFRDEFSATAIDTAKWNRTYRYGDRSLTSNNELQCYMEANVTMSGGLLRLTAKKQSVACPKPAKTYAYTSGAIASFDKFSQAYGYFEMRAKLPAGKGIWPAFWLLPQSGVWPPEIDIMENLGHQPKRMYMTYHYNSGGHKYDSSYVDLANTDYHTFGVDWAPGVMAWYIDGKQVKKVSSNFVPKEPMYILANLAVGGNWPGNPDSTTVFPSTMYVDYIRVYERVSNGQSDATPPFGKSVSVVLQAPVNGKTYTKGSWVTLTSVPSAAARVDFYVNSKKVCEKLAAPYNCSYQLNTLGSNVIKAVAISSAGASATATATVTVK